MSNFRNYEQMLTLLAEKYNLFPASELSRWFSGHPIDQEQASKLFSQLQEILRGEPLDNFCLFCVTHGLGTFQKKSFEEIAKARKIDLVHIQAAYHAAEVTVASPKAFYALCFTLFGEREYGRIMVASELRLRNMRSAFRSVSGRDLTGHSITAELPPHVCEALAKAGYLTVEDVSRAGVRINMVEGINHIDRGVISDALDRLGLDNRVNDGLTIGRDDKDLKFTVRQDDYEARIFFHPGDFSPDKEEVHEAIKSLVSDNLCTGGVYEHLLSGEVKLWFNPLVHTHELRSLAIHRLKKALMQPNPAATLHAGEES